MVLKFVDHRARIRGIGQMRSADLYAIQRHKSDSPGNTFFVEGIDYFGGCGVGIYNYMEEAGVERGGIVIIAQYYGYEDSYLPPAVTSTAVAYSSGHSNNSMSGPYTPLIWYLATI